MVAIPNSMVENLKLARKSHDKLMLKRCKVCGKTMSEGGLSGTPNLCATCLRGGE